MHTNCPTSRTFLWAGSCHTDDSCCRSLWTVWSGYICFRRFLAPADQVCLFLQASDLSTLTTAQQLSLCSDCNWGDGTPPANGEGKASLRSIQAKDKPHLQLVWCDGGWAKVTGRQNMDENMEDQVSINLSIYIQLMTSISLLTDACLWYSPALPSQSASQKLSVKFVFHDPSWRKKGLQRRNTRGQRAFRKVIYFRANLTPGDSWF